MTARFTTGGLPRRCPTQTSARRGSGYRRRAWAWLLTVGVALGLGPGQEPAGVPPTLRVGIATMTPFAMRDAAGHWSGLSVDLWRAIARRRGWRYELRDMPTSGLVPSLAAGALDLVVTPLPITYENERKIDFSYVYLASGLGIAVPRQSSLGLWMVVLRSFLSSGFLKTFLSLLTLLLLAGSAVWFFERHHNPHQFGGPPVRGISEGIWWAAVTLTTVGYGDKVPTTVAGRLLAMLMLFTGIGVVANITGHVTSLMTLRHLGNPIRTPNELKDYRVATVPGSDTADYLQRHHFRVRFFPDAAAALQAVGQGRILAFVAPSPVLKFLLRTNQPDTLTLLPFTLSRRDYAFGLPDGSPLRRELNAALLNLLAQPAWDQIRYRYLED